MISGYGLGKKLPGCPHGGQLFPPFEWDFVAHGCMFAESVIKDFDVVEHIGA